MSATLMMDRQLDEVGDTDAYNRLQMRGAIQSRGDATAEPLGECAVEELRVLVVDNHRDLADTTSRLVGLWGHKVRRAYDGTTGLALTAAFEPNVLLLDIVMPVMNGLELTQQIRQQAILKDCFVVAITGCTDEGHRKQCMVAGVDLFLLKPVSPSILKALLLWEAEYALRARQERSIQSEVSETFQQTTGAESNWSTQSTCPAV